MINWKIWFSDSNLSRTTEAKASDFTTTGTIDRKNSDFVIVKK